MRRRENARRSKRHEEILSYLGENFPFLKIEEEYHIGENLCIDIYIPSLFVAIEIDGEQHDRFNSFFHNDSLLYFNKQLKRDKKKNYLCKMNNITLIRIKHNDKRKPEEIFSSILLMD